MAVILRVRRSAFIGLCCLLLGGCGAGGLAPVDSRGGYGPAPPGFYRVRPGDTLSEIAERRRISMRRLAAWNDLGPPYRLYAGGLLRIEAPAAGASSRTGGARKVAGRSAGAGAMVKTSARPAASPGSLARASGVDWAWPLRGPVLQSFSASDRARQGIRIAAASGTPVTAAADGTVVYSGGGLEGYGNLIIVKHSQHYLSAYGFNRALLAAEGAKVRQGQRLAEVGRSVDGKPMLHFEIRRDGDAVDPLLYLPPSR